MSHVSNPVVKLGYTLSAYKYSLLRQSLLRDQTGKKESVDKLSPAILTLLQPMPTEYLSGTLREKKEVRC
jgi:hypothetical protein